MAQSTVVRAYRHRTPNLFTGLTVIRCDACGLEYAEPMPASDELDTYYESGAYDVDREEVNDATSAWHLLVARAAAQVEFVGIPESWLDIGGGYGYLLDAARRVGCDPTAAVEPSPLRRASLEQRGHRVFHTVDELPGGWDVISFSHVLEHLAAPLELLERVRNLQPRLVFCEVPGDSPDPSSNTDEPHVLFFSQQSLVRAFERTGFTVTTVVSAGRSHRPGIAEKLQRASFRFAHRTLRNPPRRLVRAVHPVYRQRPGGIYLRLLAVPT